MNLLPTPDPTRTCTVAKLLLLVSIVVGCHSPAPQSTSTASPEPARQITAVGYPLSFFAEQLVDESIEIHAILPLQEPLTSWRPSRAEILAMQKSDIIFINGSAAPFASWLPHVTLPESKICATANDGLKLSDMISIEDVRIVHSHGPEGEHSHPTMVAYTWLDPAIASKQVAIMADRLAATYPELKPSIAKEQRKLTDELTSLSSVIQKIAATKAGPTTVLTDSPDLKFLTRALGLNDVHLNWKQTPSTSEAETQLEEKLASITVRPEFMLFGGQPSDELRSVAESFQLKVIETNLLASDPIDRDYFRAMSDSLDQLKPVFGGESDHETKSDPKKPNGAAPEQN